MRLPIQMELTRYSRLVLMLGAVASMAASCPPAPINPGIADATPPSFVAARAGLEPAASSGVVAEFELSGANDVSRIRIGSDLALRLTVIAGDADTGISNLSIISELRWRCRFQPGSPLIGVLQTAPIAFASFQQPSPVSQPFSVNVRADPVAQTGCDRSPGRGAVDIAGFVRVTVTNGASPASTTTSRTFIFDYEDAIGPPTGTRLSTGEVYTPYIAECRSKGVPIPPDWSTQSTDWVPHGDVSTAGNNILQPGSGALVWTYTDPRVRGACIALPRTNGGARGGLAGIICQSATTGHACFWDSRRRLDSNPGASTPPLDWASEVLRMGELKDATTLTSNDLVGSGVCTNCHHGENVFIVAPTNPVWASVLKTANLGPNFTTRVEASSDNQGGRPRYIPITGIGGASRAGWGNPFSPPTGGCADACHETASAFPNPPPMPPTCGPTPATVANCYR